MGSPTQPPDRGAHRHRTGLAVAAVLGAIWLTACGGPVTPQENETTPVDAPMAQLREEPILSIEPAGVVAEPAVELPADGQLVYTNGISRRFLADSDEALAQAAQETYDAAIAGGWSGEPLSDPGSSGVYGTTLEKGELYLDISYPTSASFDLLDSDEDVLALTTVVSTRSTDLEG